MVLLWHWLGFESVFALETQVGIVRGDLIVMFERVSICKIQEFIIFTIIVK